MITGTFVCVICPCPASHKISQLLAVVLPLHLHMCTVVWDADGVGGGQVALLKSS